MKIKHSKYKNTGILFELLVRQITADTLRGTDSQAVDILKKYFVKTQLGKEYKLYESILKSISLTENKANITLSTILESSQKLNRGSLRRQKYNLVNEIKKHYDIDIFFNAKVSNYKELAALYTLIESYNSPKNINTNQIIDNKITILEHLTKKEIKNGDSKDDILNEFQSYDKDLRILTYRLLLEKFNDKYKDLTQEQKQVLKEFINSIDSTPSLRKFYNDKIIELKAILLQESKNIQDKATQIKILEIAKMLTELDKNSKINNDHLVDLLQYYELIKEINISHGQV